MKDYYLEDPSRLRGQPKRTIAEYVKRNGVLVPTIFDTLREAIKPRVEIRARSEHPQDYDGVSGLLTSPDLSDYPGIYDEGELKLAILESRPVKRQFKFYCEFFGLDEAEEIEKISFSFWEKLDGYNRTIVADSAVGGRYHITTFLRERKFQNYSIYENGRIVKSFIKPLPQELVDGLENLVSSYETVRRLPHFDPNHCPILEVQTVNGKNYFLQYHRTRDFERSEFSLDREPEKDEVEAYFVRGATPPEGIDCKVTVAYADVVLNRRVTASKFSDQENAFYLESTVLYLASFLFRKMKVMVISLSSVISTSVVKHQDHSILLKPEISLVDKYSQLLPITEAIDMVNKAVESGEDQHIDLHIISDGRRAFVRRN